MRWLYTRQLSVSSCSEANGNLTRAEMPQRQKADRQPRLPPLSILGCTVTTSGQTSGLMSCAPFSLMELWRIPADTWFRAAVILRQARHRRRSYRSVYFPVLGIRWLLMHPDAIPPYMSTGVSGTPDTRTICGRFVSLHLEQPEKQVETTGRTKV